jgi:hypothetical protein
MSVRCELRRGFRANYCYLEGIAGRHAAGCGQFARLVASNGYTNLDAVPEPPWKSE